MDPSRDSGASHFVLNMTRVLVGLLFFMNGFGKLNGTFGWEAQAQGTQLWWAGAIEALVGFLLAVGLATRPAAILGLLQMLAAYWIVHLPQTALPWANQNSGERAVLFALFFLLLAVKGGGAFSVDGLLGARKRNTI